MFNEIEHVSTPQSSKLHSLDRLIIKDDSRYQNVMHSKYVSADFLKWCGGPPTSLLLVKDIGNFSIRFDHDEN